MSLPLRFGTAAGNMPDRASRMLALPKGSLRD
jgi:hypothetical protein